MSKARTVRIPEPIWEAFEFLFKKEDGPFSEFETVNGAAAGMFLWATTFWRNKHLFAAHISNLRGANRDLVYALINFAAHEGIYLGDHMPKPATGADILALAKAWRHGDTFRVPSGR